jgi:transcriptional regulator with XRE-family HTH domain
MKNTGETISIRLKELRETKGLSLQDVADLAGASKAHVWDIERGKSQNPTINLAVAIANALGVSLDYLTGLSSVQPNFHPEALRIATEIDALLRNRK